MIEFTRLTIPIRNCSLNLTDKNIQQKKFKVCLEYHLGNCKGPCEGLQSNEDYKESIDQLKNLLRGNLSPVIRHFKEEMKKSSIELEFSSRKASCSELTIVNSIRLMRRTNSWVL